MDTTKIVLAAFLLFSTGNCLGQVSDDFSDGDFLLNPAWQGDNSKFVISGSRLKLQAPPTAGQAVLTTPSQAVHEATWEFALQFDFNPSSSNYAKIYLMADQPDFQTPLKGYFVKVGHSSREVSLFIQTGGTEIELIDGLDDRLNLALVNMKIRVVRKASGTWELFADMGRTGTFVKEGTVQDETHTESAYFGIHCIYTSTRADKFWFDDVAVVGTVVPDTNPPAILGLETVDSLRFRAKFSEPLNTASVAQTTNVFVIGAGVPESAKQTDQMTVEWTMHNPLTNGVKYEVEFSGFADLAGNPMPLTLNHVLFFRPGTPQEKDVIFTEVFSDPTPQIDLPAAEFLEIYNRSNNPFDLTGWELSDGSSIAIFPPAIILPGTYRVISSSAVIGLFPTQPDIIGLSNFPSLNNTGDVITLKNQVGKTIDSVNYVLAWYRDEDKAGGGWSLELIDTENPCGEEDNWAASEDARGGTPGKANSILAHKPDLTPPLMEAIQPRGRSLLSIRFNEKLMESSIKDVSVSLLPEGHIKNVFLEGTSLRSIAVELSTDLQTRKEYRLEVRGLRDCSGNYLEFAFLEFGLPEPADKLDVVISEVLFNPRSGGVDFIELYNASEKFIDVDQWTISNEDAAITLGGSLLRPKSFVVLTADPAIIWSHYPSSTTSDMLGVDLPAMPDDIGQVILADNHGQVIDEFSYTHEWHSELLKSDDGVSLERIDTDAPTQEKSNWASASSVIGFATPGYTNSQQRLAERVDQEVEVVPEIFAPGNVGFDFVQIHYQFNQPGRVANVTIVNHQGVMVKRISSNDLLGSEGFLRWDGDREDGTQAPAGYYVVWFETFQAEGIVATFRRRVVIARR